MTTSGEWQPVLRDARAQAALAIAREVAVRCTDPRRLAAAIGAAGQQTAFPEVHRWMPQSVAQGDAGLALMCAYCDACFPGERWDHAAHDFVTAAAHAAERANILPAGAFAGLAGLVLVTSALSRGGTRYGRLLTTLEDELVKCAVDLAAIALSRTGGVNVGEFDVVSGLSGIVACALGRCARPDMRAAVEAALAALVHLLGRSDGLPRWHTPRDQIADTATASVFPHGNLNCGLAHGLPGPVAALAVALSEGREVDGQRNALRGACDWLVAQRVDDQWGVNWPTAVPLRPTGEASLAVAPGTSRAAWCYGSPGIARSLWLAGAALSDAPLQDLAVAAMEAVYRRPIDERRIDSPTFCHGTAGLLQVTLRFADATRLPVFANAADALTSQLLSAYEASALLGFRNLEPRGNRVDQASLIDGASGVVMVLLAAATNVRPAWDRLFLLS